VAALTLAGCVGHTEFATEIGSTSATVHGVGMAGPEGTDVYFEYWPTADPASRLETPHRSVDPGASGVFDEPVEGLEPETGYSFRICGDEDGRVVCAQTLRFETSRDNVHAWGATATEGPVDNLWDRIDFGVFSGPQGERPTGRAYNRSIVTTDPFPLISEWGSLTDENITCLEVDGNVAVVGFTNDDFVSTQNFALLEDRGPTGSGLDMFMSLPNDFFSRERTDCSMPLPQPFPARPLDYGEIAISDN
jgi:hypothetical protein